MRLHRPARITAAALTAALVAATGFAATMATAAVDFPDDVVLSPADGATAAGVADDLTMTFGAPVQAGSGNITLLKTNLITAFTDPLDDASLLSVTTGSFFAGDSSIFAPDGIFGVNDGAGGGDFGGDTPADRVTYSGFTGGFLEATGVQSNATNPVVVEWTGIDVSGLTNLWFSADFASALQPDVNDFVRVEARIDGGGYSTVLEFTSPAQDSTFEATDTGEQLSAAANDFARAISGTGTTLDLRITIALSGVDDTGDDIAFDNVSIGGNSGTPTTVATMPVGSSNVSISGSTVTIDPTAILDQYTHYSVLVDPGALTDTEDSPTDFAGFTTLADWSFTTGATTPLSIVALSPADDSTSVPVDSTFSAVFDRTVSLGSGPITIHRTSDDGVVAYFEVTSDVSISTTNVTNDTISVTPTADLDPETEYYLLVASGAVEDASVGSNSFAGIAWTTAWSVTTAAAPVAEPSPTPSTSTTPSTSASPAADTDDATDTADSANAADVAELAATGPSDATVGILLAAALIALGGTALALRSRRA